MLSLLIGLTEMKIIVPTSLCVGLSRSRKVITRSLISRLAGLYGYSGLFSCFLKNFIFFKKEKNSCHLNFKG